MDPLIKKALQLISESKETTRKSDIEDRLDYYKDNFKDLIKDELKDQFQTDNYDNMKAMIDDSINLVQFVIDEISTVYHDVPKRTIDGKDDTDDEDNQYFKTIKKINYDLIMDKANKLTNVCNEVALVFQPRNDIVEVDLMTPNMFSIIQDKNDAKKIYAFIYEVDLVDSITNAGIKKLFGRDAIEDRYFVYYDVEGNHFKFDNSYNVIENPDNPNNKNPYKDGDKYIIPVVLCHRKYLEDSVFDTTSGDKLYSATRQIGVISTLFNYYLKNASHKQTVITGNVDVQIPDKQILDVLRVIKVLGENADIKLLDFQGDLKQFNEMVDAKIERTLNQEGLALDDFKKSGSPESGYKLQLKKEPLQKRRSEQIKFWRIYENDAFKIMQIVNNYNNDDQIPDTAKFNCDFAELKVSESAEEKRKDNEWNLLHNLTNPLQLMMDDDKDLDEKQAEEKYTKNKAINDRLQVNTQKIDDELNNQFNKINGKKTSDKVEPVTNNTKK